MTNELVTKKMMQDALGTAEDGQALIEVARNAHKAEQQLAELIVAVRNENLEAVNKFLTEHNSNIYVD